MNPSPKTPIFSRDHRRVTSLAVTVQSDEGREFMNRAALEDIHSPPERTKCRDEGPPANVLSPTHVADSLESRQPKGAEDLKKFRPAFVEFRRTSYHIRRTGTRVRRMTVFVLLQRSCNTSKWKNSHSCRRSSNIGAHVKIARRHLARRHLFQPR